ncbi:hypothetical protein EFV37_07200 [Mesorhizobium loti]|nr:hypothetical protein EB229_07195 [Mesorhizobium jarvisii]QKD08023.1 hypothetical protein EFV37_07200 [Mesorhizobium loti]
MFQPHFCGARRFRLAAKCASVLTQFPRESATRFSRENRLTLFPELLTASARRRRAAACLPSTPGRRRRRSRHR